MEEVMEVAVSESLAVVTVRYEGSDAASHEIDLNQLGLSMQGFAHIFAMCAHVLLTGRLAKHVDATNVHVVALPVAEHHCFEVVAVVKKLMTSSGLWSGAFGAVLAVVVQYVLSRRDQEDMKYLKETVRMAQELKESLAVQVALVTQERQHQEEMQHVTGNLDKLVNAIDKLAITLRPAVRQALAPIDRSCERIDLYAEGAPFVSLNTEHKRAFANAASTVSDHLAMYTGVFSGFDMRTGECQVTLEGDSERTPAIVVDPVFNRANNPYVQTMAAAYPLRFVAKAELDANGEPVKLYISDTAERGIDAIWG